MALASAIFAISFLLVVWSFHDFHRGFTPSRVLEYFNLLSASILFPSSLLFLTLPRLARKRRSIECEIAILIVLGAFIGTIALCANTVYTIAPTTAFGGLFYFVGIGIQLVLIIVLFYINVRTKSAEQSDPSNPHPQHA